MNAYFFLEDEKSFRCVLPVWLQWYCPKMRCVKNPMELQEDTFLVESGRGYPKIFDRLRENLELLDAHHIHPDIIIVMFDTDDDDRMEVKRTVAEFESRFHGLSEEYEHIILPMRKCFETWLLGNRAAYPDPPAGAFAEDARFYDVSRDDPERMEKPEAFEASTSMYHFRYLQRMLRASCRTNYSKGHPMFVSREEYFRELQKRVEQTDDLETFRTLMDVFEMLRKQRLPAGAGR